MRKVIAAAMAHSKREIPHYYLGTQIHMSRALAWLQAENLKRPITGRLLYSVALLKAVALAIREVPEMNGFCSMARSSLAMQSTSASRFHFAREHLSRRQSTTWTSRASTTSW